MYYLGEEWDERHPSAAEPQRVAGPEGLRLSGD